MLTPWSLPARSLQAGIQSVNLASAAVGATNVLGTLIASGLIEKAGRKQLLNQSYWGMGVSMLVMAAGFGLAALAPWSGTIALAGTLAYILRCVTAPLIEVLSGWALQWMATCVGCGAPAAAGLLERAAAGDCAAGTAQLVHEQRALITAALACLAALPSEPAL
jgi:hypothetical protein